MPDQVHLWRIEDGEQLVEVNQARLDLESRLQEWLASDIAVLDPNLLVIGREVETDFRSFIDMLCVDGAGDLVVVELKRDKTPREVVAQALDYASWVDGLSNERITTLALEYLGVELEDAFKHKFDVEVPETLNGDHRILVVGSEIDAGSERIIKYLSEKHGVNINAATFQYFRMPDGSELLARIFLLEPSDVELSTLTKGKSKRHPNLTYDQLQELADEAGVGELYAHAVRAFEAHLQKNRTRSSIGFTQELDGSRKTIFSLLPGESSADEGLHFHLYKYRFAEVTKLAVDDAVSVLPVNRKDWNYTYGEEWSGYEGFFASQAEVERVVAVLKPSTKEG